MAAQKCIEVDTFRAPAEPVKKADHKKLAVSAESIARALYQRPAKRFDVDSALTAFVGVQRRRNP
ncbi:MAG: hypothetical protein ACTHN1_17965 [Pseudoxanthomonas sp.]